MTDDVEVPAAGFLCWSSWMYVCSSWAVQKSLVYVCGKWRISCELCTVMVGLDAKALAMMV